MARQSVAKSSRRAAVELSLCATVRLEQPDLYIGDSGRIYLTYDRGCPVLCKHQKSDQCIDDGIASIKALLHTT